MSKAKVPAGNTWPAPGSIQFLGNCIFFVQPKGDESEEVHFEQRVITAPGWYSYQLIDSDQENVRWKNS